MLPVEYYHVVFTVPPPLKAFALRWPRLFYNHLLAAVRESLQCIAADPRHLGAQIGGHLVLHTWGQQLNLHPHVHALVPGVGLSADGNSLVRCRNGFLLPVRVLSSYIRGRLLSRLARAIDRGELVASVDELSELREVLHQAARRKWVVYSKPPCGGPEVAMRYLARYVARVAISNQRLGSLAGRRVEVGYKDYRQRGRRGTMRLDAVELLRRFLLHALPDRLVRVRSFGLLASRSRTEHLRRVRELLGEQPDTPATAPEPDGGEPEAETADRACPRCGETDWKLVNRSVRPLVWQQITWTFAAWPFLPP